MEIDTEINIGTSTGTDTDHLIKHFLCKVT